MSTTSGQTFRAHRIGEVLTSDDDFTLQVDQPYRAGLQGLVEFSHVIVAWWAHEATDQAAEDTVMADDTPYLEGPQNVGVFSTRSPSRPTPLGLSVCAVTTVDQANGAVGLGWIDALDGTPVVDIKPYFPSSDRVRDVATPDWCATWPPCLEDSADFAWETVLSEL